MIPSKWIVFTSGPLISTPLSSSKEIPAEVMLKGNAIGGDIEDLASFMNLKPASRYSN